MANIYQNDADRIRREGRQERSERPISGSAVARIVIWSIVFFLLLGVFSMAMLGDFLGTVIISNGQIHLGAWAYDDDEYVIGNGTVQTAIREISVDWVAGSVTVEPTDGERIVIADDYSGDHDAYRLRWSVEDGELSVKYCKPSLKTAFFDSDSVSKNLTILIPKSMLDEVDEVYISTFSADQNIRVSAERLELEAVSGEISIAGEYDHVQIETVRTR